MKNGTNDYREFLGGITAPLAAARLASWGIDNARVISDKVESLIAPVFASLDENEVAAYAVGGFGRRELAPYSDVDLLLLTTGKTDLSGAIAGLWDLGIKPSILIRSGGELLSSVSEDLKFATTLLDARHLYGFELPLLAGPKEWITKARPGFLREQEYERRLRLLKNKGAGFQEPNIRDGRGGLRDIQLKRWLLKARGRDSALSKELERDYGTLLGGRILVHLATGKREDRLLLSDRDAIRARLGAVELDAFRQEILLAMKRISFGRYAAPADAPSDTLAEFMLRLGDVPLRPLGGYLRLLDERGALGEMIPAWRRIEGLVRNDAAHLFTPDEHTLRAVELLESHFNSRGGEISADSLQRHDLLVLAALFHDIGKGSGRSHEEEGALEAERFMRAAGFTEIEVSRVSFLVRKHMILSYNAFRRDIDDPQLIHDLAKRIGDVENLAMLYWLTLADLKAVSHELWNDWKARLLDTLAARLHRQCTSYLPPDLFAREAIARRRVSVGELMKGEIDERQIVHHFNAIDGRYALAHTPEQIARHLMMIPRLKELGVVIERSPSPAAGCMEIVVITDSHHGLFAEIAGTISARGLDILSADISTRTDGIAIDTFRVRGAAESDKQRWDALEKDLMNVIKGEISVAALLEKRLPYVKTKEQGSAVERRVDVDNAASGKCTIVEVMLPDEIGLLYRIASAFRDCGINISSAIVNTEAAQGVDVFYVTDAGGRKIEDGELLENLKNKLIGTEVSVQNSAMKRNAG